MSKSNANSIVRCAWVMDDPLYIAYHDEEWGVPKTDDRALFEKLVLEGFQAGLSWLTVLRKRKRFKEVFDNFDPQVVARYDAAKVNALMSDPGIIRNRAKIEAAIINAQALCNLQERISLSEFLWNFVDGWAIQNQYKTSEEIPAKTPLSSTIARVLKSKGFRFVGPTTVYAYMQSVGLVNDHLVSCCRHQECAALSHPFEDRRS